MSLPKVNRVCIECGSDKTYTYTTHNQCYESWVDGRKRYGKNGWLCGKCAQRLGRRLGIRKKEDQRRCMLNPKRYERKLKYNKEYLKEWRRNNPEKHNERRRLYILILKIRLMKILGEYACVYCGCQLFPCLQFDHKNSGGRRDLQRFKNNTTLMRVYYVNHPEEARRTLQVCCANCNWLKKWRNGEDATLVLDNAIA